MYQTTEYNSEVYDERMDLLDSLLSGGVQEKDLFHTMKRAFGCSYAFTKRLIEIWEEETREISGENQKI
jgi:hypothetical protein